MVPTIEQVPHSLQYTGERVIPGTAPTRYLQEHAARYVFAARYCGGKRVLDVAAGQGYGSDYLRRSGAKPVGLEIDANCVQYAKRLYPETVFIQGDAENLPEEWGEEFDRIVSFETIEHLTHPEKFLEGAFFCLRPGGLLICSTPNKNLYVFEGAQEFHAKEFYQGEFVSFIGSKFQVLHTYGQSFHHLWHVVPMVLFALAKKSMRGVGIGSLGLGRAFENRSYPSPFVQSLLEEDRVLPEFLPSDIPGGRIATFLIVVAQKE